jgi:RPA family protein
MDAFFFHAESVKKVEEIISKLTVLDTLREKLNKFESTTSKEWLKEYKMPIMFHGKTGKHLCRICTETIDILSINVKRKNVFYLYIVITML